MLKARAGFTLSEVMVALVLTAVIGAAVTGVFVSQVKFYDAQEKATSARGVSRGGLNMLVSELRMVETSSGIVTATDSMLSVHVPYRTGLACYVDGSGVVATFLPADPSVITGATYGGYAYRDADGTYTYMANGPAAGTAPTPRCVNAGYTLISGGAELRLRPTAPVTLGAPVFIYQLVTYYFRPSTAVPGTLGLWRQVGAATPEELVAPFDVNARFRYYVSDATPATTAPGTLSTITGVELTLDGLSERRTASGSASSAPFRTSIFFRNRL